MSEERWTIDFQYLVRQLEDATTKRARLKAEMDQAERDQANARAELREHWDKWTPKAVEDCPTCAGPLAAHWWCEKCGGYPRGAQP